MHTHADPRVHHTRMSGGLQKHHRQIIGCVAAVTVHAADGKALAAEAAAVADRHTAFILKLSRVIHLDIDYLEKLESKFLRDGAILHVRLIEWIQPLVHAAVGDGVAVAFHLDQCGCNVE